MAGIGTDPGSQVEAGDCKPNVVAFFLSVSITTEVRSVKRHNEAMSSDLPGDNVGFSVKNICIKDTRYRHIASDSSSIPAMEAVDFPALMIYAAGWSKGSHNLQVCSADKKGYTLFW